VAAGYTIIERLQPYHRRKYPDTRRLWQLHEISRIDKHRLLHLTYTSLRESRYVLLSPEPIQIVQEEFFPGPLKAGTLVARWTVAGPPVPVQVNSQFAADVEFGKATPARSVRGESVVGALHGIIRFIATDVLPPLAADMGLSTDFGRDIKADIIGGRP
jgi:hypothetical protein